MGRLTKLNAWLYRTACQLLPPKYICMYMYQSHFGKKLNLRNPKDLNEKINWLKFYGDTSMWTDLADKYRVRDYVKSKGLEHILIPLYAKWDTVEEMNVDELPQSFVLKTNHGSGDVLVVKDKAKVDWVGVQIAFNEYLKTPFGRYTAEPHYLKIKPCIIAEKFLDVGEGYTTSLVDYKIWCFDGEPKYIWACYSRTKECTYVGVYDLEWNYYPEKSNFTDHYRDGKNAVPKPECLEEMINVARMLSNGFPQVRVDLYELKGKVYFGEMTFTSNGGYQDFYSQDFLNELGSYVKLPQKNK